MSELLQEFVDSRQQRLRVDRAAGVIRGVKLLGLASRNGRRYREEALVSAVSLYEGAKVNINHPKGHPLSPRDYQDRLGVVRGVEFRAGEGLFGDLHFNPKHALSEQLVWDAEHAPQNVGMSHNVLARTKRSGDETVVEAITKVQSIDLVADPATTDGLYEHTDRRGVEEQGSSGVGQDTKTVSTTPLSGYSSTPLSELTLEQLRRDRLDLVQEIERGYELQLEQLQTRLDEMIAKERAERRRSRILELLQEYDLPLPTTNGVLDSQLVSQQFIESLMQAPNDESLRRLIEERSTVVHSAWRWNNSHRANNRPQSRDQFAATGAMNGSPLQTAAEFAAAIK